MHRVIVARRQQERRSIPVQLGPQLGGQGVEEVAVLLRRQRRMVQQGMAMAMAMLWLAMRRGSGDGRGSTCQAMLLAALGLAGAVARVAAQAVAEALGG